MVMAWELGAEPQRKDSLPDLLSWVLGVTGGRCEGKLGPWGVVGDKVSWILGEGRGGEGGEAEGRTRTA